jgi:glutamyl-tRNA synthetase
MRCKRYVERAGKLSYNQKDVSRLEEPARNYVMIAALLNAIQHSGKAELKAVITRVLAEHAELRKDARQVAELAREAIEKVNSLSMEEQKSLLLSLKPSILEEEKKKKEEKRETEKKELPPLPDADKYKTIVTRFAPNPDSALHLGSTRAIILSHDYARIYKGKFILRFEDTDPRLKKSALHLYEYIKEDLDWLSCRPDEIYYQSDRLEIYYDYAEKLIGLGGAYVCTCKPEAFRKLVAEGKACPCRSLSVEENMKRWNDMLSGRYKEGEAVLRVKTDLNHPNPAVRDWPAMRIIDTRKHRHPRVGSKYRVWPLYNWSAGLDDHLMGITHIIRGQEHATNAVRQKFFYSYFGWKYPTAIHYGRLKIEGAELSKSKVERGIREGRFSGYDDPRLATLRALKRRGIRPEAIRRIITEIGPKPSDVKISWENLYAYNRQIIDPTAPRHFALFDPAKLRIRDVPRQKIDVKLPLHPSRQELGYRSFSIYAKGPYYELLAPGKELEDLKGKAIRLIGLMNIKLVEKESDTYVAVFTGDSLDQAKRENAAAIQWLPAENNAKIEVVMSDASVRKGIADIYILDEKVDTVIQFERLFFARVDSIDPEKATLYFTSK